MKEYFTIEKSAEIWIYGYGALGQNCTKQLEQTGYYIRGYIDQRAKELSCVCEKNILCPTELSSNMVSQEVIVIICLQNGLSHEKIAHNLYQSGINKLVYLPMEINKSLYLRQLLRRAYKEVMQGGDIENIQIPRYDGKECLGEIVLIRENKKRVAFWCSTKLLHSACMYNEDSKRWNVDLSFSGTFLDRPIAECQPYIELFQYLQGIKKDVSLYMQFQGRVKKEEQDTLLDDRKRLYQVYEKAFKYEQSFFADSPSMCKWNDGGYFNVLDGMHRIFYLLSKGYDEVPIEVDKEDYDKYIRYLA